MSSRESKLSALVAQRVAAGYGLLDLLFTGWRVRLAWSDASILMETSRWCMLGQASYDVRINGQTMYSACDVSRALLYHGYSFHLVDYGFNAEGSEDRPLLIPTWKALLDDTPFDASKKPVTDVYLPMCIRR